MIISELTGGLGNQMFQYAFGYSLARQNETDFLFWYKQLDSNTQRELEITYFNISALEAQKNDFQSIGYPPTLKEQILEKLRLRTLPFLKEKTFTFDTSNLLHSTNLLVQGYWQSDKYFSNYSSEIQNEFTFREELRSKNIKIAEKMMYEDSVSVHVRRGDYATNVITNAHHGLCSIEYYQEGMSLIERTIKNPIYYFFSDDLKWVNENLQTKKKAYYIDWNTGRASFKDMQLMSHCKHNLIANSSFSWWGAWLNTNPQKIVIAPRRWFNDTSIDTSDLIPDNWITI
jgi:hypothetical protein